VIRFGYELRRAETGELLAEGETTHIVADSGMTPRALPEKYLKVFRQRRRTEARNEARN
jgi:acyl-CoA thioester hydrolase